MNYLSTWNDVCSDSTCGCQAVVAGVPFGKNVVQSHPRSVESVTAYRCANIRCLRQGHVVCFTAKRQHNYPVI